MLRDEGQVSPQGFMECFERTLHFSVPFEIQHLNVTIFEQLITRATLGQKILKGNP